MKIQHQKTMFYASRKQCTLLVPDYLNPYFEDLRDWHGGLSMLLGYLIKKFYRKRSRLYMHNDIATTIKYQDEGLSLHRADFRPVEWDWVELKLLANSYNMSKAGLLSCPGGFFVFLLQLELAGALEINYEFDGVPSKPTKIILHQSITRYSIPVFTRLLRLRV